MANSAVGWALPTSFGVGAAQDVVGSAHPTPLALRSIVALRSSRVPGSNRPSIIRQLPAHLGTCCTPSIPVRTRKRQVKKSLPVRTPRK